MLGGKTFPMSIYQNFVHFNVLCIEIGKDEHRITIEDFYSAAALNSKQKLYIILFMDLSSASVQVKPTTQIMT